MSVNEQIIEALSAFEWPVVPGAYLGTEDSYFTFNCSALPEDFGDDGPGHERVLAQIHLFCPYSFNSISTRRSACRRLFAAGFTWPTVTDASASAQERTTEGQHFVFECELGVSTDG